MFGNKSGIVSVLVVTVAGCKVLINRTASELHIQNIVVKSEHSQRLCLRDIRRFTNLFTFS